MSDEAFKSKEKSVKRILFAKSEEIRAILDKQGIILAYLFGSQAKESVTPLSDIDIAVFFSKDVPLDEYSDGQIKLITEFMKIFSRNDIDVVILNTASPFIKYNTLKGQLFYSHSDKERIQFEVKARREYFDTQRIRDVQNKTLINRYLG